MSHEVLSISDYQKLEQGYIVDNVPWQEEIKRRLEEKVKRVITEPRPTLGPEEFQPLLLAETPEAMEEVKAPEPTPEEIMLKARADAEETAKSIEQAAKKNAFEIVEQARWEANDLLAKAKEEAEKEVQQMKETASEEGRQEGLKDGLKKGLEEGFVKGRDEGNREYSDRIKKWNDLSEGLASERKKILGDMQPILVELLGEALYRCLKDEGVKNGQLAVALAQEALKKAQDRVNLKLHLNPEDIEEVKTQKERLQLSVGAGQLELVPDARIEKGGCLLETEAGSVDTRLSTVVTQVKDSLGLEMIQK